MSVLRIPRLRSGGMIVTYRCTSRCRHCLVASSPRRENRYIDAASARAAFRTVKQMGCSAMHIGGGEPFLDPEGLVAVGHAARAEGVEIDYVETNSSWFRDPASAHPLLERLQEAGISTLLVSISPFHTEFVPFSRVRGVMDACLETGSSIFPWVESFLPDVSALDEARTHALEEHGGKEYIRLLPSRYWIHLGGRAVVAFRDILPRVPLRDLPGASTGCAEIMDTSHFHVDVDGNYIPGLCAGLAIGLRDLDAELNPERYPLLTMLAASGPAGLLQLAQREDGFTPQESYLNKCDLCLDIRRFLFGKDPDSYPELAPAGFYTELLPR
jgi:hypothetical protein